MKKGRSGLTNSISSKTDVLEKKENLKIVRSFGGQRNPGKSPEAVGPMGARRRLLALGQGILIAAAAAYSCYRSLAAFVLFMIPACVYPVFYERKWRKERLRKLESQFKEAIQIMSGALSAGYSVENAVSVSLRELEQLYGPGEMIVREFAVMAGEMKMNRPVEEVFQNFADRSGLEEAERFSQIFQIAKRSGGKLVSIICRTVSIMEDRGQVNEEIRTMTASVQFEQKVMSVIPFFMILYIDITSPGFFQVMYETVMGKIIMSCCLAIYLLSCYLSRKILDINVA